MDLANVQSRVYQMLHGTGIIYLYIYHTFIANVVKTYSSPMAPKIGRKKGIFPEQYAFIEGSILEKGQAQNNVKSLKPGPFWGSTIRTLLHWKIGPLKIDR